jgi:hypothetical protein
MASRMSVFEVARLRRPALLALYFRTCLPTGTCTGGGRDVAQGYANRMSREALTAAIVTAWETAPA